MASHPSLQTVDAVIHKGGMSGLSWRGWKAREHLDQPTRGKVAGDSMARRLEPQGLVLPGRASPDRRLDAKKVDAPHISKHVHGDGAGGLRPLRTGLANIWHS
jgi:hypothetical protein